MPDPLPGCWYWHTAYDCPVYVRRIDRYGMVHYDLMQVNGNEWPTMARGIGLVSEFDPWPLRGLQSESLMQRRQTDGSNVDLG